MCVFLCELADLCWSLGGHVAWEWPRNCSKWSDERVVQLIAEVNINDVLANFATASIEAKVTDHAANIAVHLGVWFEMSYDFTVNARSCSGQL